LQNAKEGLELDEHDLDFLVHAGLNSAILRKNADAAEKLDQYLSLSQTPGADQKRRAEVYNALAAIKGNKNLPEPEGKPNWFSGYKSPPGVLYCPLSLIPNARIVDVKARKQTSVYQWNGDQLTTIRTTSQDPMDKESTFYFEYFKNPPGVRRVAAEPFDDAKKEAAGPRFTPKGTVGTGTGAYLGLPNYPEIDPLMVERLTGKRVATIVAGNPYFHPFVWNGLYSFIAEYDDQGRVKSARQIADGDLGARIMDFKWDGWKLMEVAERGGDYKRTMTYSGNILMEETIAFRGKVSKIEYKYKGEQLIEANSGEDASIDGRPRHVTFR
jgi:hypothetical protein